MTWPEFILRLVGLLAIIYGVHRLGTADDGSVDGEVALIALIGICLTIGAC